MVRSEPRITHCSLANPTTANAKFLYPTILERLEAKCTDNAAETTSISQQNTLSVLVITSAAEGGESVFTASLAVRCAWRADNIHVITRGAGSPIEEGALFFLLLNTASRAYSVL